MRIATTGPNGKVGRLLVERHGVFPLTADITDPDALNIEMNKVRPHVVIHLAGLSNVDYCEKPENFGEVMRVNYHGALNVIKECDQRKIQVVYVSTEQIFSGKSFLGFGGGPYKEFSTPAKHAVNAYALSKLGGEALRPAFPNVMHVVRTSYLFDWTRIMTELVPQAGTYSFPTFIRRSYLYMPHFAQMLHAYAERIVAMPGVMHLAGTSTVSQYEFVREFVEYFGIPDVKVKRRFVDHHKLAPRPHRAGLNVSLSARYGLPQFSYWDGFHQMERDNVRG